MSCLRLSAWLILFLALAPSKLFADCKNSFKEVEFIQTTCSAGLWANLSSSDGSLAKEMPKLLAKAEAELASLNPPPNVCPADCIASPQPFIVSRVVPSSFVTHEDYKEAELCKRLEQETAKKPIEFNEQRFDSIDKFSDWFSKFSRGKGKDGEALYEQCPGDCSISYETIVQRDNNGIKSKSFSRCGIARNKEEDQYKVSLVHRWNCEHKSS